MKVIFVYADGRQVRAEVSQDNLSQHGILKLSNHYFVFSHFVKGEDAVEYVEASVFNAGPML